LIKNYGLHRIESLSGEASSAKSSASFRACQQAKAASAAINTQSLSIKIYI
jgi:hypothetical protein